MPYNIKKIGVRQANGTYILQDIGVDYSNVEGLDTAATAFKAKKDINGNDITNFFKDASLSGSNLTLTRGSGSNSKTIAMAMQGATSGANGSTGFVPAPSIGDQIKYLRGDGTWQTLGTASKKDVPSSGNASISQVVMGNDTRLSDSRPASDVSSWAKASSKPSYGASEITAGTFSGKMQANSTAAATLNDSQVRNIIINDTDIVAGTTTLASGSLYVFYG